MSNELGLASRRGSLTSGEQYTVQRALVGEGPGEDTRTTVMIRNIPNKYTQKVLNPILYMLKTSCCCVKLQLICLHTLSICNWQSQVCLLLSLMTALVPPR